MSGNDSNFELELQSLMANGKKIEAIKLYRERTGAGLAEAKEAVEAFEQGQSLPKTEAPGSDVDREIVSLLEQGKKIQAVKLYRERTGVGLKEAKDAVDAIAAERHILAPAGSGCLGIVLLFLMVILSFYC